MSEHQEQKAFFKWLNLAYPDIPAFAIPNGGHRHIAVAKKLKDEGVRKGIPDIFIADGNPGLFIELKVKGGRATPEQQHMLSVLMQQGYRVALCYGWIEAKEVTEKYLDKRN